VSKAIILEEKARLITGLDAPLRSFYASPPVSASCVCATEAGANS
jgi:hypothetical protein